MHRFDKKLKPFAAVIHQLRSFITLYKTMNSVNLNKYSKDERSPFELNRKFKIGHGSSVDKTSAHQTTYL